MSWTTHVTIDGRDIGMGRIGLVQCHSQFQRPHSIAYFCHHCGEIWARIFVEPNDDEEPSWMVYTTYCQKHGLGSIDVSFEKEHMAALPLEALKREFLLQCEDPEWYFEYPWRQRLLAYDDLNSAKLPDF